MHFTELTREDDIHEAAELSCSEYTALRESMPFLPARSTSDFYPRLQWISENGYLLALNDGSRMTAFLGWFPIDNFRNAGPGAFSPDWAHGISDRSQAFRNMRILYREAAARHVEKNIRLHAAAVYATQIPEFEALGLTGFGRIVMDAARPVDDLSRDVNLACTRSFNSGDITLRRAGPEDGEILSNLNARLAEHIGDSPVFMPDTCGDTAEEWTRWFGEPNALAFIALQNAKPIGYIRAEDPQFDVSFAVHDPGTLAINGLYVDPAFRGKSVGAALLQSLVDEALVMEKSVVSVDCETLNPEAYGFWSKFFRPVAWGMERRV